jgi:hypothetical protein
MPLETDLLTRLHANAPQGLARGAQNTIAALLQIKGKLAEVGKNRELTPVGRAAVLKDFAKKEAVPDLYKSKRQFGHAKAVVDGQRAASR